MVNYLKFTTLFLISSLSLFGQKQITKDTVYVTKNPTNNTYFVTRITNYSDESSNVTKDVIGDSLTTTKAFLDFIEQESDKLAQAAIPIIMKASSDNVMGTYSKLFQEVSNRSIWSETNAKYGLHRPNAETQSIFSLLLEHQIIIAIFLSSLPIVLKEHGDNGTIIV